MEKALAQKSGQLWGTARATAWGNGPPCVKAYVGPLPPGSTGYSFTTATPPSRIGSHMGQLCAYWVEGATGVFDVPGKDNYVRIQIEVIG